MGFMAERCSDRSNRGIEITRRRWTRLPGENLTGNFSGIVARGRERERYEQKVTAEVLQSAECRMQNAERDSDVFF